MVALTLEPHVAQPHILDHRNQDPTARTTRSSALRSKPARAVHRAQSLRVEGGHVLGGSIAISGSKNEILPVLAATLLTDRPVTLHNVPRIRDVLVLCELLERMGCRVAWEGSNTVTVHALRLHGPTPPADLCQKLRASILLAGPLLARLGEVHLAPPGGDVIGRRRLDTHVLGLTALGATVDVDGSLHLKASTLTGADIFLDEPSVTATENILMAAVLARGTTMLRNAACEPHVQGLCRMLCSMGARIGGIGTNTLTIEGSKALWGCSHTIGPDALEAASYIGLAAVTHSALTLTNVNPADLCSARLVYGRLGITFNTTGSTLTVPANQELAVRPELFHGMPKIDDGPWPAFPTDMMSVAITVATQCQGSILFFEKMYDGRMFFTDSLCNMGARITLCDPHRVVVSGKAPLHGATLESPDVRAGMALLVAALCAQGTSTIHHVHHIDRGYERVEEKLRAVGARLERLGG